MRQLTRRLLGLEMVYLRPTKTGPSFIGWSLLIIFALMIGSLSVWGLLPGNRGEEEFLSQTAATILTVTVIAPVILASLAIGIRGLVRGRLIQKARQARRHLGDLPRSGSLGSHIDASVIVEEAMSVDGERSAKTLEAKVIAYDADWWLYDASFTIFRKDGYGDSLPIAERCYTVLESRLRQPVPHLIFDSRRAKGRQFRSIYTSSDQLPFSGDLAPKFIVHYPKHHEIDTLSFITPEVIESLIALDSYDFELINDRLFCYAPFLFPDKIDLFQNQCLALRSKINGNLRRHQPESRSVKAFGGQLVKRSIGKIVAGGFLLAGSLGLTALFVASLAGNLNSGQSAVSLGSLLLLLVGLGFWLATAATLLSLKEDRRQRDLPGQQYLDRG